MSMPNGNNMLSGLQVGDAMRRQVIRLPRKAPISHGITAMVKYKISALLALDEKGSPAGVVSKTDVMGAYYAAMPIDTPVEQIMSSPPLFCTADDSLEAALEKMKSEGVYRLYVTGSRTGEIVGTLAYPDIVGLLYQYCHPCAYSHHGQKRRKQNDDAIRRFRVSEVMTPSVESLAKHEPLNGVMEALSAYRFGAMLITAADKAPCGVISKTDLVLAYRHGVDARSPAEAVMTSPVRSCDESELLEDAIQKMIFSDLHRIFIHRGSAETIVGVLSLTDAARRRSGSCHACIASRIKMDNPD